MIHRISKLSKSNSFFLFGARGTGKSSLVMDFFKEEESLLVVDLLKAEWEDELLKNPDYLIKYIEQLKVKPKWVIIDEVQKIPKVLDIVHYLIEKKKILFALTGSSARKLKRGAANMLAGRAFAFDLFPLSHRELESSFQLHNYISFGGLPALLHLKNNEDKENYLRTYVSTYLKEEIQAEQIVRQLKPFRLFLDVAAQMNAKIINYSKIGIDIGVDTKTVQNYFEILRDTHLGLLLPAYDQSLRKRQSKNPKFYYFDTGIVRALNKRLNIELKEGSFEFGDLFEQFIILEAHRLNSYFSLDYSFSYLHTNNGLEVDLIIDRPALPTALVEIKSSRIISEKHYQHLLRLKKDYPKHEYFCLSNDPNSRLSEGIKILPWKAGLEELGFLPN